MPTVPDLGSFAELCAEAIRVPSVDPAAGFYEAGGDSSAAIRLAVLLGTRYEIELDLYDIIAARSLTDIHAVLLAHGGGPRSPDD
ncbi:acyl carrier protein [Nocardia takedensis]